MSRVLSCAALALIACGDDGRQYTYELDAEIVASEEVSREIVIPSVVEIEWMGELHQPLLLCEPIEGELHVDFSHSVTTMGHASHQIFTARVVPWPDDVPCDEELLGTFTIQSNGEGPYEHVFVFEDEVGALGARDATRHESVTVEVAFHD